MKISNLFLGAALAAGLTAGACDNSKADLDKTKTELTTVTGERDSLKSQLDASKAHEAELTKQVSDMNAKMAAAQPAKDATPKAPEHAMATPQKKEQKASKKSSKKG